MRTFSITTAVLFLGVATFGLVASTFAQESAETSQVWLPVFGPGEPARNGDMNASGDLDVTDVIRLAHALFNGGRKPVSRSASRRVPDQRRRSRNCLRQGHPSCPIPKTATPTGTATWTSATSSASSISSTLVGPSQRKSIVYRTSEQVQTAAQAPCRGPFFVSESRHPGARVELHLRLYERHDRCGKKQLSFIRRHGEPLRGMDCSTDHRGIPVVRSSPLLAAGSRRDLRRRVHRPSRCNGYRRSCHSTAKSLAESVRRENHRLNPPGVSRPRDRAW